MNELHKPPCSATGLLIGPHDAEIFKKRLLFTFALAMVYLFPLLATGEYYADDLFHSIVGQTSWVSNGRPLSALFMHALMAGGLLNDISPLPQILGAAVLSTAATLLSFRVSREGAFLSALLFFPLLCSPYFLENWSYKYDSLTMALAIFAATFPFMSENMAFRRQLAVGSLAVFISLGFYQAAANIFISLTAIFFFIEIQKYSEKEALRAFAGRVCGYAAASAVYFVAAKRFFVAHEYTVIHSETVSGNIFKAAGTVWQNLIQFNDILLSAFIGPFKFYCIFHGLVAVVFLCGFFLGKDKKNGAPLSKTAKLVAVLALVTIYLASFGPMLLLKNPVFFSRTLIGASGIFVFIFVCAYFSLNKYKVLSWALIVPVFGMFVLAYSYYNALRSTEDLERAMIADLKASISRIREEAREVAFYGAAPFSGQAALAERNFPLIGLLVRHTRADQDSFWAECKMKIYRVQVPFVYIGSRNINIRNMKVIGDGGNYLIRFREGLVLVDYETPKGR